ncbi:putative selenate reductase subunit YgfK [Fusobacterium sp. PH5-44]|uniref:putative selenate reductase subunit YgfK n=1 Tax=unclassified Fusobacterium TaxID=2648384 RepID=UPI003D22D6E1
MSDIMTPIPFNKLVEWILVEKKNKGTIFGIRKFYKPKSNKKLKIFKEKIETPFGPAAGPATQLAQNIIASYCAGSRFFELKTVQIMDGEELSACVNKPCILAEDEGYNCEWSTELEVPQAFEEYIKAWIALKVLSKEFELGNSDGFVFNMSVGYDLEGIKSPKIDKFIEEMKDASNTKIFQESINYLKENIDKFENITIKDIENISANVCTSITLSTLHGCPPEEIEKISTYLINEKSLNTYIKCNPTLLGYKFARNIMDEMGYDYLVFDDHHFKNDLQYSDAVPMIKRLLELGKNKSLEFGVKITNTFPVKVAKKELPSEEMYMSGRALYPLSISLANKLSEEFHGKLRISYSGGADAFNIEKIFSSGIWPITMATTILKPGGYERFVQISELLEKEEYSDFEKVDTIKSKKLSEDVITDSNHIKPIKHMSNRKIKEKVSLINCFIEPCNEGCPINQDITAYMSEVEKGNYKEAFEIITDKNPLPFITGTICPHNCMTKCTRNFYEAPVNIRKMKLIAAERGYDDFVKNIDKKEIKSSKKIAIIGGGPAGLSCSFFLGRAGYNVTIFEKRNKLGGIVQNVIPEFRISNNAINKDIELVKSMGVEIVLETNIKSIETLKKLGYEIIVLAIGASKPSTMYLEKGQYLNAISFLEGYKENSENTHLGKNVVVVGGGNTAMDTARAAKRVKGVENVAIVYRRDKRNTPADEEELTLALNDGVQFKELLLPVKVDSGMLQCRKMILGPIDSSGRQSPVETDELIEFPVDTIISATGEQVNTEFYKENNIKVDIKGKAVVDKDTLETNLENVYVIGDGLNGPATVVEGIRDSKYCANAIAGKNLFENFTVETRLKEIYSKHGILEKEINNFNEKDNNQMKLDATRCLKCATICENCVEVCPNRANISINVAGMKQHQIIHIDYMCNECGNCNSFCPYNSAPYKDKLTYFKDENDFNNSNNNGFIIVDEIKKIVKLRYKDEILIVDKNSENLDAIQLFKLIETFINDYSYIIYKKN